MARTRPTPAFTVISGGQPAIKPPRPLGKHGMAMWTAITGDYPIEDAGGVAVLSQVCEAQDRLVGVTEKIKRDGLTITTKNGLRDHPLLRTEVALRAFITANLDRLGLNVAIVEKPGPGRPTKPRGWTGE